MKNLNNLSLVSNNPKEVKNLVLDYVQETNGTYWSQSDYINLLELVRYNKNKQNPLKDILFDGSEYTGIDNYI